MNRLSATLEIALLLLVLSSPAKAQSQTSSARVWEELLVIPTYELGPANRYPKLFDGLSESKRPIYPYPMLDTLGNVHVDKSYKAVILENEYLRVTVLPQLGGKLYAIYDKTAKRDVLYTNHVVKYGIVAIRGAWTSGGIEWNFPDGHTVTTASPIDYCLQGEPDGSATVTVGDIERIQRMQWAVTIRLRPGKKYLETEVRLYNRQEVPGRYWFWATAAAPATDDMRFVYPMREAYPHFFWPIFSFPKEKGVDLGTYREVPNELSLFARNSKRDFFGVYYEKSDWGIVHVADHHQLPGKKTWTWGTADSGRIWIEKLTDKDGQYVEFQAGRYETQMEHEFLPPHRIEHFTEFWYPVNHLGGSFDEATRDAAVRARIENGEVRITANVNSEFQNARLIVEAEGVQIHSSQVNLHPARSFVAAIPLPAGAASKPLTIRFQSSDGLEFLRYRTDTPLDGNPEFKPATRPIPDPLMPGSAEQLYVEGLAADKKSDELGARKAYGEALKRDPGFAPAHIALGLSYYRTGEYEIAADHLTAALRRNKDAVEGLYYLGLVRRKQGKAFEATERLLSVVRAGSHESAANYFLGEMALEAGDIPKALIFLTRSVKLNPEDIKSRAVLAMAERMAGKLREAKKLIDGVVSEIPIDLLARREQYKINKALGLDEPAQEALKTLWSLLGREPDSILELAFDYLSAGQKKEAIEILEEAIHHSLGQDSKIEKDGLVYPMIHYTLAYLYEKNGDVEPARFQYGIGAKGNPSFVFPHRLEEIEVLRAARKANAEDGRAAYYLGNAWASKYRYRESLQAWRDAVRLDPDNTVARRNLALALRSVEGQKAEAVAEYEKAIASAPGDVHLYVELCKLLAETGETERRIRLLEKAPEELRSRSVFAQSLAAAYADAGRFADAIEILQKNNFTSGEGEAAALEIYRRDHLGMARKHQQAERHLEAAAEFLKATEFPLNLGVGRPGMQSQARELVAAARELEAAGNHSEAISLWKRAADEPLNSPVQPAEPWSEHYYYKALALDHTDRKKEAQSLYRRLARLINEDEMLENEPVPPGDLMRFLLGGLALKQLGNKPLALAALQHVLQIDPTNELARAELTGLE